MSLDYFNLLCYGPNFAEWLCQKSVVDPTKFVWRFGHQHCTCADENLFFQLMKIALLVALLDKNQQDICSFSDGLVDCKREETWAVYGGTLRYKLY